MKKKLLVVCFFFWGSVSAQQATVVPEAESRIRVAGNNSCVDFLDFEFGKASDVVRFGEIQGGAYPTDFNYKNEETATTRGKRDLLTGLLIEDGYQMEGKVWGDFSDKVFEPERFLLEGTDGRFYQEGELRAQNHKGTLWCARVSYFWQGMDAVDFNQIYEVTSSPNILSGNNTPNYVSLSYVETFHSKHSGRRIGKASWEFVIPANAPYQMSEWAKEMTLVLLEKEESKALALNEIGYETLPDNGFHTVGDFGFYWDVWVRENAWEQILPQTIKGIGSQDINWLEGFLFDFGNENATESVFDWFVENKISELFDSCQETRNLIEKTDSKEVIKEKWNKYSSLLHQCQEKEEAIEVSEELEEVSENLCVVTQEEQIELEIKRISLEQKEQEIQQLIEINPEDKEAFKSFVEIKKQIKNHQSKMENPCPEPTENKKETEKTDKNVEGNTEESFSQNWKKDSFWNNLSIGLLLIIFGVLMFWLIAKNKSKK